MAGQSSAMFGWSWTEASVLGSQVFGRALMVSCDPSIPQNLPFIQGPNGGHGKTRAMQAADTALFCVVDLQLI